MRVREGDLFVAWHPGPHALVITTNGELTKAHEAVMGRGVALRAAQTFPEIRRSLGKFLDVHGNHCFLLPVVQQPYNAVVSFPTKNRWRDKADIRLIERSCHELVALTDLYGWAKVYMPRPGCGAGDLRWEDVRKVVKPLLDDRFVIVWEPGHDPKPKSGAKRPAVKVGAVSKAAQKRMATKKKKVAK